MMSQEELIVPIVTKDRRISAGFVGKPYNFRNYTNGNDHQSKESSLVSSLGFDSLVFLKQVHSAIIVTSESLCDSNVLEADGIIIDKNKCTKSNRTLFGIRTADCLPIYIETQSVILLLHGGWRGIASGICQKAISLIPASEQIDILAIGPCASGEVYEVGPEVIAAIENPVYTPSVLSDKFLIDLPQTAINYFSRIKKIENIFSIPICTITNNCWHSYRRDPQNFGSNLLYCGVVMP
jgi:copper oxidase (laccase) domain-containing protein